MRHLRGGAYKTNKCRLPAGDGLKAGKVDTSDNKPDANFDRLRERLKNLSVSARTDYANIL